MFAKIIIIILKNFTTPDFPLGVIGDPTVEVGGAQYH